MRSLLRFAPACALLAAAAGCASGGTLRNGTYEDDEATYHLGELPSDWRALEFAENDLAWASDGGQVIAVNAVCEGHGDPSLKVLTDHLLMGFEERAVVEREELRIDGRGALRTKASASLDGVPVELELTLLKKDGCVYDMVYTSPAGRFADGIEAYRSLVSSFRTVGE